MIPLIGKTLNNRYRIEEHIGRGGMAEVYRAYDQLRGVDLALKVMREDLAEDKIFLRRFGQLAEKHRVGKIVRQTQTAQLWKIARAQIARTPTRQPGVKRHDDALEAGGLDAQRMRVRLQFKYSMPLACLVFALVAAPLGARYARFGSFAGIVVSIIIVFLYNGVRSWGLAFGLVGELDPIAAAWAQNVIFGVVGLWLFLTAD